MPKTQVVQADISQEITTQATEVLASMGLTTSDVIRILFTKIAKEKTLPLELFELNQKTLHAMKEVENDNAEIVTLDQIRESIRANN